MPFQVRAYGLPFNCKNTKTTKLLGNRTGSFLQIGDEGKGEGKFFHDHLPIFPKKPPEGECKKQQPASSPSSSSSHKNKKASTQTPLIITSETSHTHLQTQSQKPAEILSQSPLSFPSANPQKLKEKAICSFLPPQPHFPNTNPTTKLHSFLKHQATIRSQLTKKEIKKRGNRIKSVKGKKKKKRKQKTRNRGRGRQTHRRRALPPRVIAQASPATSRCQSALQQQSQPRVCRCLAPRHALLLHSNRLQRRHNSPSNQLRSSPLKMLLTLTIAAVRHSRPEARRCSSYVPLILSRACMFGSNCFQFWDWI